jgi:DHA1 family bicyclomycin/chloramphenicol resistance-like MFS transporter
LNDAESEPPPARARIGDRALLALLAAVTAVGPISTNLYIPVLPEIREYFDATVAHAQATFSIALVTFAVGMLFWGPVSDRHGRRPAILAGLAVFGIGAAMCLFAPSLGWLVVGRGVQAFGTATGVIVARAIVSDRYPFERMTRALAHLTMVVIVGNATAPAIGGFLASLCGWRAIFGVLLVAVLIVAALIWRFLPETLSRVGEPPRTRDMLHTTRRLLTMPLFLGCVVQCGVVYVSFLVFMSLAPYVMVSALGRPATEFGFYYLLIAVGYFLGNWSVGRLVASRTLHSVVSRGLALQVAGAACALVAVMLGIAHPLGIFAPIAVLAYGHGLSLPNVTATAVSLAPQQAGVASSVVGFLPMVLGALAVQCMGVFPTDTAYPVLVFCTAIAVLGTLALRVFPRFETPTRR